MKKLLTIILTAFLITTIAPAVVIGGELTDGFNLIITEKEQREDVLSAKSSLIRMTKCVNLELAKIQAIIDSGTFDTVPNNLKVFLLKWRLHFTDLKGALAADPEIVEVFTGGDQVP